jgi:hypothetical protein
MQVSITLGANPTFKCIFNNLALRNQAGAERLTTKDSDSSDLNTSKHTLRADLQVDGMIHESFQNPGMPRT